MAGTGVEAQDVVENRCGNSRCRKEQVWKLKICRGRPAVRKGRDGKQIFVMIYLKS